MNEHLKLVAAFHKKFQAPILDTPSLISDDQCQHRYRLMKEEVEEYKQGIENRDLPNIAKELADTLYTVYGTILEHGLQDKMDEVFKEVHNSNMSKDYHKYKMLKWDTYFKADIDQFFPN